MKQTRRMAFAPSNGHVVAAGGAAAHVLISRRRRRRWRGMVKGGREGKRRGGEQGEMGEGFVTPHSDILEFNIAASPHQLLQPSVKLKSHGLMVTWSRGHMIWRSHDLVVTWSGWSHGLRTSCSCSLSRSACVRLRRSSVSSPDRSDICACRGDAERERKKWRSC